MPIQRNAELRARRTRRAKIQQLRRKYQAAKSEDDRNAVLAKLGKVHPMLSTEAFLKPVNAAE